MTSPLSRFFRAIDHPHIKGFPLSTERLLFCFHTAKGDGVRRKVKGESRNTQTHIVMCTITKGIKRA